MNGLCCDFRPFYRTEMLIITAKNDSQWMHSTDYKVELCGAVLRKDLLHEVQTVFFCSRFLFVFIQCIL